MNIHKRIVCCFTLLLLYPLCCLADVKTDAAAKIKQYYSMLQQYAADPTRIDLNDRIKNLFVDGQGSVYNDVYTILYNNPVTNSDILNYVTAVTAYKNRSGGYSLNFEVNENSFQYKVKDANTVYVTASKRVYCQYGARPTDFVTREVFLIQNNKIVCVFKEGTANIDVTSSNVSITNIEFGSKTSNEVLAEFGETLYAREIPYLRMKFTYTSKAVSVIYLKIFHPDGQLSAGDSSPEGYTTKYTLSPSSEGTYISSWGNDDMSHYKPGNYTVEVWTEGTKLYSTNLYLHSKGPIGKMKDVKVELEGDNLVVKSSFDVVDFKGQKGEVICYFYDGEGNPLVDQNSSYYTTTGKVCSYKEFTPTYDYSVYTDLAVKIPQSELHLSGTHSRTLKVISYVWDKSTAESKVLCKSNYVSFTYNPAQSYLSVSQESTTNTASSKLSINNVEFGSKTSDKVLAEFGETLYAREIPYLRMKISYKSTAESKVYLKIINPDGVLSSGTTSPDGYTTMYTLSPSSQGTYISSWGNDDMSHYKPGNYTIELWSEGSKLYSTNLYLYSKGPVGKMKDVKVTLEDDNVVVKSSFDVVDFKGQKGEVICYFYDGEGNPLVDQNSSYYTTNGKVCSYKEFTPTYDYSVYTDLEVKIPQSELHLSGTHSRTLKVISYVWDKSTAESKVLCKSNYVSFTYNPQKPYLNVSPESISFDNSGGSRSITVDTNCSWEISVGTASWGSTSISGNTITLKVESNSGDERTDYIKIKAAGIEKTVNISQSGANKPSAVIKSVTQEHNVFVNNQKGMKIKTVFTVNNMIGESISAIAFFYGSDNMTKLLNKSGSHVYVKKSDTAPYKSTEFTMTLFMPYNDLNMVSGFNGTLTFDIVIRDSQSNQLVRKDNNTFTFSKP